MNIYIFIAVVSFACTVVGFAIQLLSLKIPKIQKWIWVFMIFIMTFITGMAVYYHSEAKRIDDIHRQAEAVYEHYLPSCDHMAYMQEMLTFLEEVRERYPYAYERAKEIYAESQNMNTFDKINATIEMRGIVKGIATLNEQK